MSFSLVKCQSMMKYQFYIFQKYTSPHVLKLSQELSLSCENSRSVICVTKEFPGCVSMFFEPFSCSVHLSVSGCLDQFCLLDA